MNTDIKSIAEVAYQDAATKANSLGLPIARGWIQLDRSARSFYDRFAEGIIEEHLRRKPPLQTEEHWMLLAPEEMHVSGDEFLSNGDWAKVQNFSENAGTSFLCRRLVRVPADCGWVKCSERTPGVMDSNEKGQVETWCPDNGHDINEANYVAITPFMFTHWRTPTPPPVESEPVDECLEAFKARYTDIPECSAEYQEFRAGWNARSASLTKEDAK